jgi:transposase
MPKDQRTYTKEFKLEAVQLVQTSGKSMVQVARDLGIADSTLYN